MDRNVMEGPPNADTPQGKLFAEGDPIRISFEVWRASHWCPDGLHYCPRCYIDYATYLACEEVLNADA